MDSFGTFTNPKVVNNAGTLALRSGSTLDNTGGTINNEDGGVIDLVINLASNTAGTINLNTGSTLNSFVVLHNGPGNTNGDTELGAFNRFAGSTLNSHAAFTNTGTFNNIGTLKLKAGSTFDNTGGIFNNNAGAVIDLEIDLVLGSATAGTINLNAGSTLNNSATLSFENFLDHAATLNNSGTVNILGQFNNNVGANITNDGEINIDNALLTNRGGGFTNDDTINVTNFGTLVSETGTLTNNGTINGNSGVIANIATMDNNGDLNSNGSNRLFNTFGATLNNFGTLTTGNEFNNQGGSVLNNNANLTNEGKLENGGTLNNNFGAVLDNAGTIRNSGMFNNNADGTVTLLGGSSFINDLQVVNAGQFDVNQGASMSGVGTFTQTAGTTIVNGTMQQTTIDIAGGVLKGFGTVMGDVTVSGDGVFAPGTSPGTFTIDGNLLVDGLLELEMLRGVSDLINVTGDLTFGAAAQLNLFYDVLPGAPISIEDFFGLAAPVYDSGFGGGNIGLFTNDSALAGIMVAVLFGGEQILLTTEFGFPTASIPIPPALPMLLVALIGFGIVARRRSSAAA